MNRNGSGRRADAEPGIGGSNNLNCTINFVDKSCNNTVADLFIPQASIYGLLSLTPSVTGSNISAGAVGFAWQIQALGNGSVTFLTTSINSYSTAPGFFINLVF